MTHPAPVPSDVAALLDSLPLAALYGRAEFDNGVFKDLLLLYANPPYLQQARLPPVTGQGYLSLIPEGEKADEVVLGVIAQVAATGQSCTFEHFQQRLGNWYSATVYSPHPGHIVGIFEDISPRKVAEQKIRLYESIVQSSQDAITSVTLEGLVTSWNSKAQSLFGYSAAEMLGKPIALLAAPEQLPQEADILNRVRAGIAMQELETQRIHKDGHALEVSLTISPVHDGSGNVVGASHIARDISQRKHAELAQAQSERKWRELLAASPIPLCMNDDQGNVVFLNPAFVKTFGYRPEEIPHLRDWWDKAYPEAQYRQQVVQGWAERLQKAKAEQAPFQDMEVRIHCKNGEMRSVIATAAPLEHSDEHLVALVDVSELVATRQSLQRAQRYAELIVDSVGEGLCQIDEAGRVAFINPVGASLLGRKAPDMVGQLAHTLFQPATGPAVPPGEAPRTLMRAIGLDQASASDEEYFWRADGTCFAVHFVSAPMVVDGLRRGAVVTFRDISEELRNRAARADDEIKIRKAQEMAGFGSYDTDLQTGIWQSSAQLDAIFGIDANYIHDIPHWNALLAPEFQQAALDHYQEVARGEKDFRLDYRIIRPSDGVSRWVAANGELLRDAAGTPVRLIGTIQDITERKEIEEALKRSHDLLMKLSEQMPGALYLFKLATDGVFTIPFASEGLGSIFGIPTQTLHLDASPVFEAIAIQDRSRVMASIRDSAQKMETWAQEFRVVRDNMVYWVQGQARPERQADGSVLWYGFSHDVSNRVRTETALQELNETLEERVQQRTQELAHALESAEFAKRSRGEFLAKMSHEIRTPLNAILGMTFLALKGDVKPELRHHLQRIRDSGKHLLGIINDILDFSKIDAGKLQLEVTDFDLQAFVQRVLQLVEGRAAEKGLHLQVAVDPEVPLNLRGDSLRLGQILVNFLNNAIKFTDQGSVTLAIRGSAGAAGQRKPEEILLRFEVSDTGIGIEEEKLARLFQPFEQGDNSTTRKYGGSGLGLVISKQLAEMMGGEVGVSSRAGQGSTFWFTAQFEAPAHSPGYTTAFGEVMDDGKLLSGRHVLVVDDNDFNLDVAKGLLELVGIRVDLAANGVQALAALQTQSYDLVLMDIHMPVMDGLEATLRIRAEPRWAKLPVVAMTANAREEDRALYLNAGMNDVVIKPINPDFFYQTLRTWVSRNSETAAPAVPPTPAPVAATSQVQDKPALSQLPLWDLSALERSVGNDVRVHRRLLGKYLQGAQTQVSDLLQALRAGDPKQAGELGHKLKSSSRTVGAQRMGTLCEAIEKAGRANDIAASTAYADELNGIFEQVAAEIQAWLLAHAPDPDNQ